MQDTIKLDSTDTYNSKGCKDGKYKKKRHHHKKDKKKNCDYSGKNICLETSTASFSSSSCSPYSSSSSSSSGYKTISCSESSNSSCSPSSYCPPCIPPQYPGNNCVPDKCYPYFNCTISCTGATGPTGRDNPGFYVGNGSPNTNPPTPNPTNGDTYLDGDTGFIWTYNIFANIWANTGITMRGETGPTGQANIESVSGLNIGAGLVNASVYDSTSNPLGVNTILNFRQIRNITSQDPFNPVFVVRNNLVDNVVEVGLSSPPPGMTTIAFNHGTNEWGWAP